MGDLEANRWYANLLGWTPVDFGAAAGAAFDDGLIDAINTAQGRLGLKCDGLCGPTTYGAVLAERQNKLLAEHGDPGAIALCEAKRTWLRNIVDLPPAGSDAFEPSRLAIDGMIRSDAGLHWSWIDAPYSGNFEWCGAFASYAWRAAGLALRWRYTYFASTFRLDCWGRYQAFEHTPNPKPTSGPPRKMIELDERSGPLDAHFPGDDPPRPGDILLVGGVNTAFGKHITIVESYDSIAGMFTTVEGNATGAGPSGGTRHGVSRLQRPVGLPRGASPTTYHARRLIRPAPSDLLGQ
jgi:hypothetical protein